MFLAAPNGRHAVDLAVLRHDERVLCAVLTSGSAGNTVPGNAVRLFDITELLATSPPEGHTAETTAEASDFFLVREFLTGSPSPPRAAAGNFPNNKQDCHAACYSFGLSADAAIGVLPLCELVRNVRLVSPFGVGPAFQRRFFEWAMKQLDAPQPSDDRGRDAHDHTRAVAGRDGYTSSVIQADNVCI